MRHPVCCVVAVATTLLALAMQPCPSNGCHGNWEFTRLFQVASEWTRVRIRLQLPANCSLQLTASNSSGGSAPSLYINNTTGKTSARSVVKQMRQLPGSDRMDLLHTFVGLEPGRQYSVCFSEHVLLDKETAAQQYSKPAVCTSAATVPLPGATRWDGITAVCLFGLYILCLMLVAAICWRLRTCLGPWRGQVLCNQEGERRKTDNEPVVVTKASLAI